MGILNELANKGLNVKVLEVMTPEYVRSSWINRSKVAINLRQHADWKYPSNSRYYYHLMNHSMLVSEKCEYDCDLSNYIEEVEAEKFVDHSNQIKEKLQQLGVRTIVDSSDNKLGYKIRNSVSKKIPYSLVMGEKEIESKSFTLRSNEGKNTSFDDIKLLSNFFVSN